MHQDILSLTTRRRPAQGHPALEKLRRSVARKLWLPRPVYAIVPVVYLILSAYALAIGWALGPVTAQPLHSATAAAIAAGCLHAGCAAVWHRVRAA